MFDNDIYQHYAEAFKRLHVKVTYGVRAPHKAILLLSVIDLIETGVITTNQIYYTQQLESQFRHNWIRYIAFLDGHAARPATPFFHMSYEPFWTLQINEKCTRTIKELADERIYSNPPKMNEAIDYAIIDQDLFDILQDSFVRAKYRVLLISNYFNTELK